ncbi:unnamed protein product [Acanthoscelides obtectus]|uniref:Uncharacterized protein n=1 Tax=Acanthoscelides obtectus TaxID=200917 RepID=A0A9P0VPW7_ACAOB|nr:unnamed protein product [Acanthoscelides obtectus]CAK1658547.1 hypothetical protein AOBTE_LOCUS20973 [Acanthoscelides obtectus]
MTFSQNTSSLSRYSIIRSCKIASCLPRHFQLLVLQIMAKLSIKVFIALLCVTVITEEAVASKICDRPSIFDKKDVIAQYLKCLKSLSAEQR